MNNHQILIFLSFFFFQCSWNEWLTLPLRYCDLPRQAMLALSIHEIISPTEIRIIGSTTVSLFDAEGSVLFDGIDGQIISWILEHFDGEIMI